MPEDQQGPQELKSNGLMTFVPGQEGTGWSAGDGGP